MYWVTYLSPSGGAERTGTIDDGCVFGYPGPESVAELLAAGGDTPKRAFDRALADPVEIIVRFEACHCPPIRPAHPIPLRVDGAWTEAAPELVRGTDDGVLLPKGTAALSAAVGVAAVFDGHGGHAGSTLACLWRTPERGPAALTLGPAVVTPDDLGGGDLTVTATVGEETLASAPVTGRPQRTGGPTGALRADLPAETRPLEYGEELLIDGGPLGMFEIRVGSGA
ncbi:hypothetical protein CDO52_19365 [Nocardiopsis gilva YIM 90087]|uniref:Uncharacterized protein n=1 Tax=Nocardiopsis gilva YIM 90087 TaxID=1235441 RepID=A0A223S9B6_9ACTN|nr:hypothetical protein [Nocardiopsis gilva]ASU84672.1 hypothetical protein CDO52_19365 [Nocardiopsis gilva YIM 90087]